MGCCTSGTWAERFIAGRGHRRPGLKHETDGAIWGCLLLADDRLYVGNVEGGMTVLRAGCRKERLARIRDDAPLYSRPALVGDTLYLATAHRLYLIAQGNPKASFSNRLDQGPIPAIPEKGLKSVRT